MGGVVAAALLFITALIGVLEWFPANERGVVTGTVLSFKILAMAFMLFLQLTIVNPDEVNPVDNPSPDCVN